MVMMRLYGPLTRRIGGKSYTKVQFMEVCGIAASRFPISYLFTISAKSLKMHLSKILVVFVGVLEFFGKFVTTRNPETG